MKREFDCDYECISMEFDLVRMDSRTRRQNSEINIMRPSEKIENRICIADIRLMLGA